MTTPSLAPAAAPGARASFVRDATSSVVVLVRIVRKSWPIVAACLALATGGSLLYTKSATKIYECKSLVEINSRAPQPFGESSNAQLEIGSGVIWDEHAYYETQYKIVSSDRVLSAVVRDLGLANDPEFTGGHKMTVENAVAALEGMVVIEPIKYSQLIWIKVDRPPPALARRITDAIANAYIEQNLQTALSATSDAFVWLSGQLDHIRQD